MKTMALSLGVAIAVAACATTTSPTGRTQYVGAVSQEQLDHMVKRNPALILGLD